MSVLNTFVPSTSVSSTDMNANFTDIASEITNSVAKDGQTSMTGQLKAASGSISAPGVSWSSETGSGWYRAGSNDFRYAVAGADVLKITAAGLQITGSLSASGSISNTFASGTALVFAQTAAPTGWTKSTTHNDKALRVVSGTASSGGSVAFSSAFTSQAVAGTVGGTSLVEANLPAHTHTGIPALINVGGSTYPGLTATNLGYRVVDQTTVTSGSTGSGTTHTHTFTGTAINLAVQYVDTIIATKD